MSPLAAFVVSVLVAAPGGAIKLVPNEAEHRIDVMAGDQPFTSYMYDPKYEKPFLFPIQTADGRTITRGWPLAPRPDEQTDHPHHTGLWFNYGEVDDVDFWGNSEELRKKNPKTKVGTIVHKKIQSTKGNELAVGSDWVMPDGRVALREDTRFAFSAGEGRRVIDRVATLTAATGPVTFPDNKEGMLGLRLGRALEAAGPKSPKGTGVYRSSEGKTGDAVWGTRARWMTLTGTLDEKPVTVAILDHPKNPGHPTYWHARGYGLFAVNPLGARAFSNGKDELKFALAKGKSARFAYRIVILSKDAKAEEIEAEYKAWLKHLK